MTACGEEDVKKGADQVKSQGEDAAGKAKDQAEKAGSKAKDSAKEAGGKAEDAAKGAAEDAKSTAEDAADGKRPSGSRAPHSESLRVRKPRRRLRCQPRHWSGRWREVVSPCTARAPVVVPARAVGQVSIAREVGRGSGRAGFRRPFNRRVAVCLAAYRERFRVAV